MSSQSVQTTSVRGSMASPAAAPPVLKSRILTDQHIPQISWWSERLTILPTQKASGVLAGIVSVWRRTRLAWNYDVFISANVRNALALALAKRLLERRRPLLVMTEMRLDDPE